MAFDVMTLTVKGTELLAAATTADKLVIAGCDATTTFIQQSDAVNVENRPVSPLSTTTDTYLEKSTNNHVFIRVFFVAGQSTGGDARSLYVFGHKESDPTNNYVLGVLSSQDSFHLPEEGDISNTYGALLDIIYSPANGSVSTATTSVYATYGEFADLRDRAVTTHKRDLPTTGDDQTIYGVKTFVDKIKTLSNTWLYQGNTDYECKIVGENDGIQGIKKVGVYSDIIDNNTNINLASFEEKVVTDSNTSKNAGTLELKVSDEDLSKSAQITLNASYDSGNATSDINVSAVDISVKASNEFLLISRVRSRLASARNTTAPFANPPYFEVCTDRDNKWICFRIEESNSADYLIFFNETDSVTQKASLYTYDDNVDLGSSDHKWDNVYANNLCGNVIVNQNGSVQSSSGSLRLWSESAIEFTFGDNTVNRKITFDNTSNADNNIISFYPDLGSVIYLGTPTYKWEGVYAKKFNGVLEGNVIGCAKTIGYYNSSDSSFTELLDCSPTRIDPAINNLTLGSNSHPFTDIVSNKFTGDLYGDVHGKTPNTFTHDSANHNYSVNVGTILLLGVYSSTGALSSEYLPGDELTTGNANYDLYIPSLHWVGGGADANINVTSASDGNLASGMTFKLLCGAKPANNAKNIVVLAMRVS